MKKTLFILIMAGFLAGCYYDNEEHLYPNLETACDTTQVTFAATIRPILQTHCYACHSSAQSSAFGGSIDLENFARLKAVALDGSHIQESRVFTDAQRRSETR